MITSTMLLNILAKTALLIILGTLIFWVGLTIVYYLLAVFINISVLLLSYRRYYKPSKTELKMRKRIKKGRKE